MNISEMVMHLESEKKLLDYLIQILTHIRNTVPKDYSVKSTINKEYSLQVYHKDTFIIDIVLSDYSLIVWKDSKPHYLTADSLIDQLQELEVIK